MQRGIFRNDIQSLRAIAVIAVILYHFEVSFIKGGFIGVDIFFVISGYLISNSIIKNVEDNNFSFINFYFNRMKRLYPALLVIVTAVYAIGFFILSPVDFKELSATTIFASIGISNIYFWLTSGYFDNFASLKPLLHTWSLGVEFQFYLFWPFLLFFIFKLKRYQPILLLIITIISGIISYRYLKFDARGAFFLMPFRIHEFSIGALIFLLERKYHGYKSINNVIYILGTMLVFYSIYKIDSHAISFPGKVVWIPIVGSALMIYSGSSLYFNKIISNIFIVYIGEISYSLYLTHWPVFVFYKYIFPENFNTYKSICILVLITFIISALLYKFVEKPFRQNKYQYSKSLYLVFCQGAIICIMAISICSFIGNGWIWRLPNNLKNANNISAEEMETYIWEKQKSYSKLADFSNNGKEKILIIGDSQSADLINLLAANGFDKKFDIVARTIFTECSIPYINKIERHRYFTKVDNMTIAKPDLIKVCSKQMDELINDQHLFKQADRIFVAFIWQDFTAPFMNKSLNKLDELSSGHKLWIFGNKFMSESGINIYNSYSKKKFFITDKINQYALKFKIDHSNTHKILGLDNRKNTKFIDMNSLVCRTNNECYILTTNGSIILYDKTHFTPEGAKFLGNDFYRLIKIN